jgi:very-short-patch-repair endonuclease
MYHELARELRKNMTDAERRLWLHLRRRQFNGFKFRRQARIGPYIVDSVCFDQKPIVEMDGGQHAVRAPEDEKRTTWPNSEGYRVLRCWNHEVFENMEPRLEAISFALQSSSTARENHDGGQKCNE